ncbi:MAG: S8 family serine peptidase [Actinoplanes sp.]
MKTHLRRYAVGALAIGAIAGGITVALPANVTAAMEWRPATYGLTETPEQLLPTTVSTEQPVRVVSTTVDSDGKPVIKVETVTNKAAAAKAVKKAQTAENAVGVELDAVVTATDIPAGSDPYRSQQWDFSKISVAKAWEQSTGAGVVVAVIDSGVDATHPDLQGNVLAGYDAIADKAGAGTDPNGHGTHVAGTIAAVTGNNAGISAIAPDATILPIRALGANGSGYMSDTAEGILWAADHGASVINMSLGSSSKVTAVSNAITYARSKGVVVVASAGNSRAKGSPINYPAADQGVIGVAATDSTDKIASYSTAGSFVDVAAPGSNILSTYPTALGNSYVSMNGTSMASPHVAAVAALLKAYRPALTPDQVQIALQSSAVDLGTKGRDNDFGYGRIDAAAALAAVGGTTGPTPAATTPATSAPTPTPAKTTTSPTPTPTKTTASPTPSKPVVKVRPAVNVTSSATSVVYGTTSTVTYSVTASGKAWANQPVQIGVTAPGTTVVTWTDATTDAAGKVVVARPAHGRFQVRLAVLATDTSLAVSSPVTTFAVRAAATVTSPAKGSLKLTLSGAVGQTVQVQRYDRSRWTTVTTFAASRSEAELTGVPPGTYRFVVPSTASVTGLTSGSVRVAG